MDGYAARTYGDAFADVYDEWYADVGDPDAAVASLAALAAGGAVLELGVGSGRLAVPLAATGCEVWGIDASEAMLERLAARDGGSSVHAVAGDMADPAAALAGHRHPAFAVVAAAFNTFFLLTTPEAQAGCLRSSAALLAPGGRVVLECFVPADRPERAERVLEPRTVALDHVVLTVTDHDPANQRVLGQHIEVRESGIRLRPWVVRYATPAQLDALAAEAGLRLESRWAAWDSSAFDDAAPMHVSVYRAG